MKKGVCVWERKRETMCGCAYDSGNKKRETACLRGKEQDEETVCGKEKAQDCVCMTERKTVRGRDRVRERKSEKESETSCVFE